MSLIENLSFGEELEQYNRGCHRGGFFFTCVWFDALLAGIMFGVLIIGAQLISEKYSKTYRKLSTNERLDWNLLFSNWILSYLSLGGSLYFLFKFNWYLDHPSSADSAMKYDEPAMNFFIAWMMGHNIGRAIHIAISLARNLPDLNFWDFMPICARLLMYGIVLEFKVFGMLAVFQMLLESHNLISAPLAYMEYSKMNDKKLYIFLDWTVFFFKAFALTFAGPYCLAMMWYHWHYIVNVSFVGHASFILTIGLNTLLWLADISFGFYWIYCQTQGIDAKKWYKVFQERERNEARRIRNMGYNITNNSNDIEMVNNESSDEEEDNDGKEQVITTGHQTEAQQRKK